MQGQTERLCGSMTVGGAFEYLFLTDTLVPLKNPTGEDIRPDGTPGFAYRPGMKDWHAVNALGSTCYGYTSMLPFFCASYLKAKNDGRPLVAVHAAKGATVADYWLPGADGHKALMLKCRAAIDKVKRIYGGVHRVYFVWLQGESDALASTTKDDYKAKLITLGDSLRTNLNVSRFGIIRVGRFAADSRDDAILDAQDELCGVNANASWCSLSRPTEPDTDSFFVMLCREAADISTDPAYRHLMNPYAYGHFSAEGLRYLGERAGRRLAGV